MSKRQRLAGPWSAMGVPLLRRLSWRGRLRLLAASCAAAGLCLLLVTAYQIWDPGAAREQHRLAAELEQQWRGHPAASAGRRYQPVTPVPGQPFAFLRIPAFGPHWRFAVVEGSGAGTLTLGPGHVPGTQLPGQRGNFAVAAHDITAGNPFLHLARLRHGDSVYVTTVNGTYQYRVLAESVVRYTDVGVLDPVPGHPGKRAERRMITLISCTPVTLAFTPWRVVVTGTLQRVSSTEVPSGPGVPGRPGPSAASSR